MRAARARQVLLALAVLLGAALVLSSGVGAVHIPPYQVLGIIVGRFWPGMASGNLDTATVILWDIRLPRVVLGALVGLCLGLAGAAFQGLLKNPLADPYVVGVSAGAALGASIAIAFPQHGSWHALAPVPILAFAGGLLATTVVYRLAAVGRRVPVVSLLLAGVAVGSLCISLMSLVLYFTSPQARDGIIFWLLGGLGGANWAQVQWMLPHMVIGGSVLLLLSRELNALLLGEEQAQHLGVNVEVVKMLVLGSGTLLTAAAVAFAGTIGFVGLIVPHVVRFGVGPDHRFLLPGSALAGAILLVTADTIARSLTGAGELPVGLVMAVAGGPFFLYLLRRRLRPQ